MAACRLKKIARYRSAQHERGGGNTTSASQTEPCSSAAATTKSQASGNGNAWTKKPFQNKATAPKGAPRSYLELSAVPCCRPSEETLCLARLKPTYRRRTACIVLRRHTRGAFIYFESAATSFPVSFRCQSGWLAAARHILLPSLTDNE